MLVILKIPVVYLCLVVWWAVRAEPRPPEHAVTTARAEPEPPPGWRLARQRTRSGPHGTPARGYRRRVARAEVSR